MSTPPSRLHIAGSCAVKLALCSFVSEGRHAPKLHERLLAVGQQLGNEHNRGAYLAEQGRQVGSVPNRRGIYQTASVPS
jgi:hypothetical protein